jgi:hypothetical protein
MRPFFGAAIGENCPAGSKTNRWGMSIIFGNEYVVERVSRVIPRGNFLILCLDCMCKFYADFLSV